MKKMNLETFRNGNYGREVAVVLAQKDSFTKKVDFYKLIGLEGVQFEIPQKPGLVDLNELCYDRVQVSVNGYIAEICVLPPEAIQGDYNLYDALIELVDPYLQEDSVFKAEGNLRIMTIHEFDQIHEKLDEGVYILVEEF